MIRNKLRTALALAALLASAVTTSATARPVPRAALARVETLASYPHGAFLENLAVDPDGTVTFTSYFSKSLMVLRPGAEAVPLATLPVHPVGVLRTAGGFIITAHAIPFTDAPAFLSSNEILILGRDGSVQRTIKVPDARFLNGLVSVSADKVLIADSIAGVIWALTPSTGALRPWLRGDALTADPSSNERRPAANGLKVHGGKLYFSNSSRGAIYSVSLTGEGEPADDPARYVAPGPVDDFAFAPDGSIYAATHGSKLLRISPKREITQAMASGCDSCTSVAVMGRGRQLKLIVLTTGNLLEGGDAPARLLRVIPPRARQ